MNKLQCTQNLVVFVWHFLKPYKNIVVAYVCLAMLAGCWGPFNSILIKHIINILSSSQTDKLSLSVWLVALLVLNFVVFDNFTWRLIGYMNYKFLPVIKNQIISEVFRFVLGSSATFFQDNFSGRIASQVGTLADNITHILHPISVNFVRGSSLLIVAFISMYYVNPMFFYTLALWFLVFFSFSVSMSKHLVNLSDMHTDAEAVISGQLVDIISNVHNVQIFAKGQHEVSRLDNYLRASKATFQQKEIFLVKLNIVQGTLIALMLSFMVYFLIHLYGRRMISIGDFVLILGIGMEVGHMAWYTMSQVDEFNQAVGKCKQSLAYLIVQQEIQDKKDASNLLITKGEITFSAVKFHYKGTKLFFENKSVTIEGGQKVGLVGYSGSGKSTFVNLILRLYDVTAGRILIDGQDIRGCSQDSLRSQIAMIPQEPSLFYRTIRENIRYGYITATDDEVYEAAQKAYAHEFISKLPKAYDSLLGGRGVKLSGGQRQRIAIARAILKNAPILILDEATSQLDSVTENEIQESLWKLIQGKTTIVIAHRLSTLLHMDRILVFDQGKIVEDGIHQELLAQNGLYKTLWDAQIGGFLPEKKDET